MNSNPLCAQPKIRLSKAYWEYGRVSSGEVLKETFEIKNIGNKPLNIRLRTSCNCLTTSFSQKTINSQSSANLILTLNTKDYLGKKTDYIFIDSNDPEHSNVRWLVEGIITSEGKQVPKDLAHRKSLIKFAVGVLFLILAIVLLVIAKRAYSCK